MLAPVATEADFWAHHNGLRRAGAAVSLMAFERTHYEDKRRDGCWESLGKVEHGRYLARIPKLLAAVPKVLRETRAGDALYCFGLDMLGLGWAVSVLRRRTCPLVLATRDIHSVLVGSSGRARLLRALERFLVKRTLLVVCTSDYYVKKYYLEQQGLSDARYAILENKLDAEKLPSRELPPRERTDGVLTIGYFGLLRCPTSWDFLRRLAETGAGRIRVVAAGLPTGIEDIESDVAAGPYLEYRGPYLSPDDLPDLYSRVDLVWTIYPYGVPNQQWARTNRYYVAGYFRRPMIAQRNTPDGYEVERSGIGVLIDLDSPDEAIAAVLGITGTQLGQWENNYDAIDVARFTITNDYERVLEEMCDAERGVGR